MKHRELARILTAFVRGTAKGTVLFNPESVLISTEEATRTKYSISEAVERLYGDGSPEIDETVEDIAFMAVQIYRRSRQTGHSEIDICIVITDTKFSIEFGSEFEPITGNISNLESVLDEIDSIDEKLWSVCYEK